MGARGRIAAVYFAGVFSGWVLFTAVGAIRAYGEAETGSKGSQVFGEITMVRSEAGGVLPDAEEVMLIKVAGETFFSIFLDNERSLSQASFYNDGKSVASVHRVDNSWRRFTYGDFEQGSRNYTDIDCDGAFDIRVAVGEDFEAAKHIYHEGSWIGVDRFDREKAWIEGDQGGGYLFEHGEGWRKNE